MTTTGKIAVVDDDPSVRVALSALLRSAGMTVALFVSAEDFIGQRGFDDADCIVTDMQMPGMSGVELLDYLRQHACPAPVILVTAFPEPALRKRALDCGATCFLSKPFDGNDIIECIDQALRPTS